MADFTMKMFIAGLVLILVGRLVIRVFGGSYTGVGYIADIAGSLVMGVGVGTCLIAVSGVL
jgi:hypothetical protein